MLTEKFDRQEKRMLQYLLAHDPLAFSRYFFKVRMSRRFIQGPYHPIISRTKKRVMQGEIHRLIVNMPPGYFKTEEWVINFMAQGLAKNPQALFMHLSYSDDLALWNSTQCRDIVDTPEFQELFPMAIRPDVSSKKKWYTEKGGGVYATSAGGQVTGFRAGRMLDEVENDPAILKLERERKRWVRRLEVSTKENSRRKSKVATRELKRVSEEIEHRIARLTSEPMTDLVSENLEEVPKKRSSDFWGALIIDDPIKPDDAYSEVLRQRINNRFMNTFKSRLAVESQTPMILVMQRIHEKDPSGFLLTGGTGEVWDHLILPVEIPDEPISDWYSPEYTHGRPIDYDLSPGPLWPKKHDSTAIASLREADPYTAAAQYDQRPSTGKTAIFKPEYWKYYSAIPENMLFKRIYADTAQKTGEHNDYTVFECWGFVPGMGILLIDLFRDKLETPQLESALVSFWNKHKYKKWENPVGAQVVKIEDKSSGSGLIQTIRQNTNIPVEAIPRHRDKVMRAFDCVPQIASGNVWLPLEAPWLHDFREEARRFSPLMNHRHDDQIDPMLDAIQDILIDQVNMYQGL